MSASAKRAEDAERRRAIRSPCSRNVPAGTPIDIATDTPTIAMAIARPRRFAGAIREAYPGNKAHSRPAPAPAQNRAANVSA